MKHIDLLAGALTETDTAPSLAPDSAGLPPHVQHPHAWQAAFRSYMRARGAYCAGDHALATQHLHDMYSALGVYGQGSCETIFPL